MEIRVGQGWDSHRIAAGRPLILGGVTVPCEFGLDGHSDADILLHALTDALLGAAALGDIGMHFPDTDPRWKGADSTQFLAHARTLVEERGWRIENVVYLQDLYVDPEVRGTGAGRALIEAVAQSARERRTAGLSLLDGIHLVAAYAEHVGKPLEIVLSRSGAVDPEVMKLVSSLEVSSAMLVTDALFRELSAMATPTGILAVVPTPRISMPERLHGASVWLNDIQDPGNLGSILRSAAAAGIATVCLSKNSVHAWSPRVLRAGMGAHFALRILEGADLQVLAENYPGRIIATCVSGGRPVFDAGLGTSRP